MGAESKHTLGNIVSSLKCFPRGVRSVVAGAALSARAENVDSDMHRIYGI